MLNTIRSIRNAPPTLFSSPLPSHIGRTACGVRFQQVGGGFDHQQSQNDVEMDQTKDPNAKTGRDIMSDSFGEGYATRCDDEGFGGIHGAGNQSTKYNNIDDLNKADHKSIIYEDHPECDKSQGSEVKEKEKARHHTTAES